LDRDYYLETVFESFEQINFNGKLEKCLY